MRLQSILVAICPLLVPAAVFAQSSAPTRADAKQGAPKNSPWGARSIVRTRTGVRLNVAIAKSDAKDREIVIVVSPGGIEQTGELAAMLQAMGSTVVAFDPPTSHRDDALHAMITWASREFGSRVNVFGVGAGADEALAVGSRRTKDLWSVMVDGASRKALGTYVKKFREADAKFEGLLMFVDESSSEGLVSLAKEATASHDVYAGGPRVSVDVTAVEAAQYKARIETFLFDERPPLPPQDCLVCGPEESNAPRRVVVLDA